MAGPALTDVPDRYDVVFSLNDGTTYGFLFADSVESNLPFRTHKAVYSYSPTFLERQNVSDQYGDNFQDFFLTGSQDDFSLGEGQKFFRVNDAERSRRYWAGLNVDPSSTPGNVTLTGSLITCTPASVASTVTTLCTVNPGTGTGWYATNSTNLYTVSTSGALSSLGAHGLTASPNVMVIDSDGALYMSNGLSGVGIRKYNGSFSEFSTTKCDILAFLNNALYGYQASTDSLISFDTSGTPTTQFTWKGADGASTSSTSQAIKLVPAGGSLYILRYGVDRPSLWVYDGAGARKVGEFPPDFQPTDMCQNNGILFVGGYSFLNNVDVGQVYYFVNGSIGKLWQSPSAATGDHTYVAPYGNGVVFNDITNNNILQYDLANGGVHTIAQTAFQLIDADLKYNSGIITSGTSLLLTVDLVDHGANTSLKIYGGGTSNVLSYNTTGKVQTSQYDFDNTLSKIFRGIKIDADIPANTSVDIAYQIDGCGGTYTTLKTGATSGTEYLLPNGTSGHSISVQVTLNSSNVSATPTLKRVYVRAAPTLQQFRKREYLFDLSGGTRDELGKTARRCRDGTAYPVDPATAASNLEKIATQTIPFTVADRRTGSAGMTVLPDLQQSSEGYEGFALYDVRPNVYIGRINLREV